MYIHKAIIKETLKTITQHRKILGGPKVESHAKTQHLQQRTTIRPKKSVRSNGLLKRTSQRWSERAPRSWLMREASAQNGGERERPRDASIMIFRRLSAKTDANYGSRDPPRTNDWTAAGEGGEESAGCFATLL